MRNGESGPLFEIVHTVREVVEKLYAYRREQVENGYLFYEKGFGEPLGRADKSLIRDLQTVRNALISAGLGGEKLRIAHALIGRSIFIRYLEDRKILVPDYFYDVAKQNPEWTNLLKQRLPKPDINPEMEKRLYSRVLGNKEFTYALFSKLTSDFNGDMFPQSPEEYSIVTDVHTKLLQEFLRGDNQTQGKLFFFAYRFDVIPIELISNIYEEFYNVENGKEKTQGSFYTPQSLVEFMLSQVLTTERLKDTPRVLDPACGSGIFLVETLNRIVRYRSYIEGDSLKYPDLVDILRRQIAGIDINYEAIQVTAFSLYLAMLNHLEPPDILEHIKAGHCLPNLIAGGSVNSLAILLNANTFNVNLNTEKMWNLSIKSADIVVGNPPWGNPHPEDKISIQANNVALKWCFDHGYPVGDKERSQSFLWKARDLVRANGVCALLVSTGVLYKHGVNTVKFRNMFIPLIKIKVIFNFTHTRTVFFKESSSPFILIIFENSKPENLEYLTQYWSAKVTANVESLQSVILSKNDLKLVKVSEAFKDHRIWKVLWWGNHQDIALIQYLSMFDRLNSFTKKVLYGRGFDSSSTAVAADWLKEYDLLRTEDFHRYGSFNLKSKEEIPDYVNRRGNRNIYNGLRILVKRGIEERTDPKGRIIARLEDKKFCFRNSIHGIKLNFKEDWQYKIILGLLWSSISRYYYFLTSSAWGTWHHDIHVDELLDFPVRFPKDQALTHEIIDIVDKLKAWNPINATPNDFVTLRSLEEKLDTAVFKLYDLSEAEKDLISDLCEINLDYFYNGSKGKSSQAAISSVSQNPQVTSEEKDFVTGYVKAFLEIWNRTLDSENEFLWQMIVSKNKGMLAATFKVDRKDGKREQGKIVFSDNSWDNLLDNSDVFITPFGSRSIYLDGIVRIITENEIIIIKRNELRYWTRSIAREDAQATLLQAMNRNKLARGKM